MMMGSCRMGMMVMIWLAGLLGPALLVTLIVLLWVVIGPASPKFDVALGRQ